MKSVLRVARAGEWWEHKLAPVLATGYATAVMTGTSRIDAAGPLALVLLALLPGAVYVSVLNDLTDREADRLALVEAGLPGVFVGPPNPRHRAFVVTTTRSHSRDVIGEAAVYWDPATGHDGLVAALRRRLERSIDPEMVGAFRRELAWSRIREDVARAYGFPLAARERPETAAVPA